MTSNPLREETEEERSEQFKVEQVPPEEYGRRVVEVDLLYLDREVCDRCSGTGENLKQALRRVSGLLEEIEVEAEARFVHVETEEQARLTGLKVSPTVRVNGRDVQPEARVSECGDCEEISGERVDCREWIYRGETYNSAPVPMLVEEILRGALEAEGYQVPVPENLERYFGGEGEGGCC